MWRMLIPTLFLLIGFCAPSGVANAQTKTCQSELARLQTRVDQAEAGGQPVPDVKEGTFATMHHQPTAASVLGADKHAMAKAKAALDSARKYQAQGKDAACLKALSDIPF